MASLSLRSGPRGGGPPHGRFRRASLLLSLGAPCAGLLACASEAPAPEIRVGLLALMDRGYAESSGEPSIRGARMAEDEINGAGGVTIGDRTYRVRVIVREYAARPDAAAAKARALINMDSVHVLVGPQISAHAIPVSVIAEEAHVPMISPMSSNPRTTAGKSFVFRLALMDDLLGDLLGRFARDELGAVRAAVLYDEATAYSRDLTSRFARSFVARGGTLVARETYTSDRAHDFRGQLRRIAREDPDVLFLPNPAAADTLQMRQARSLGLRATFLGSDIWDLLPIHTLPYAQGAYVAHQWHHQTPEPKVRAFLHRFQTRFGRVPRTTAAMTYDAVYLVTRAVREAGSLDPGAVRNRIAGMDDFRGVTGLISFHGSGDPARSAVISGIENGVVVVTRVVDP